jgi:DNA-directed RNA polymerase specialized sigma24 family protein
MTSKEQNALYAAYLVDPAAHEEKLLSVITKIARSELRDYDEAQEFVFRLWQELPIPESHSKAFGAWIRRRLLWHRIDAGRRTAARKEVPVSRIDMLDPEDGSPLSNEDKLDLFQFRADSKEGKNRTVTITTINDPAVRKAAELMLLGYSQREIAERLGIGFEALRKKLQRFSQ